MKNILIINGHEYYEKAKGQLNKTLTERMVNKLSPTYNIKTTIVENGYEIKEEQEKFKWSDVIIFQSPVYWFNYPGVFKKYIDSVYEHGVFFQSADPYGTGGKLKGRYYMLSVTWAASEDAFSKEQPFFEGKGVDDVLVAMHKTHQYVGLSPLKTLSNHSAYQPDIEKILNDTDKHLQEVFSL
ncbi:NAD(P)H-dependent oxidoreductase [Bacillus subtilis]|uniref:NAD(P)H-dependent oxidoreductase n=1 Tax=Bacillus subtilis TaxID=1423 RepID=UPI003453C2E7